MNIYMVRHGEAERFGENALTNNGKNQALEMARWFKSKGHHLDKIIHSSKLRAIETAQIFGDILDVKTELVSGICPEDNPSQFIDKLNEVNESILVVTHMPFIDLVTSKLSMSESTLIPFSNVTMVAFEKTDTYKYLWNMSPEEL